MSEKAMSSFIVTSRQTKMGLDSERGGLSELRGTSEESQGVAEEQCSFTVFSLQLFRCKQKQNFGRKKVLESLESE